MNDHETDELVGMLKARYGAKPDGHFAANLLERLEKQLPPRQVNWGRYALAACLVLACAIAVVAMGLRPSAPKAPIVAVTNPAPKPHPGQGATISIEPKTINNAEQLARLPDSSRRGSEEMEASFAEEVGGAPLIVRARLSHWDSPVATFDVTYVIMGELSDKTVTVDFGEMIAGLPYAKEVGNSLGRDEIVLLKPISDKGVKFFRMGEAYEVSPDHRFRLSDYEDKIIGTIADGSAFEAHPYLAEYMGAAPLIVRAQLVQADGRESTWKILAAIHGPGKPVEPGVLPDTLVLDDQFFRMRAAAIVAHADRAKPASRPATQPDGDAVAAEAAGLEREELTMPKEAILFVDQVKVVNNPDGTPVAHGRLRYRTYQNKDGKNLDDLQKAITDPAPATGDE